MQLQCKQAIEKWMLAVSKETAINWNDLHIDQIDTKWKCKSLWIEGGLEAFQMAFDIRESHNLPFTVVLAFSLVSYNKVRDVDFHSRDELAARFDWTPPSLYLFTQGKEPWLEIECNLQESDIQMPSIIRELNLNLFDISEPIKKCYYFEFRQSQTDEYSRSLILAG